jgi:hypothetical protein
LTSTCTLAIDRNVVQCNSDSDCATFEASRATHVVCRQNVCVDSGLGPRGCYSGEPTNNSQYLNACTSAQNVPFDNCARLGLCGANAAPPDPIPPQSAGTLTTTIKATPVPTVRCADAGPNVIYMAGTSDFGPLLKQVTPLLMTNSPPYRPVFLGSTSCAGVSAAFDPAAALIKDVPATATKAANYAFFFDDAGNQVSCSLDPAGNVVDVGVSNLYSTVCNPAYASGAAVAGYLGPVVTFGFTVPAASGQNSISVEAAHIIFGLGGKATNGNATPWVDPAYYSIRNSGAGSTALAAELIHVPRTAFWGVDRLSTDNLRDSLIASAAPDASIGILSIDYADKTRGNLRVLYLQAEGQLSGFLPDSTPTSLDKINVRDGHYPLWGYVHFYTANLNGAPAPAAGAFVTRFSAPKLERQLVDAMIDASVVPQCAMRVARDTEMGPFVPSSHKFQCGCYFESRTTGRTTCKPCASTADCPNSAPACNYGFCEAE